MEPISFANSFPRYHCECANIAATPPLSPPPPPPNPFTASFVGSCDTAAYFMGVTATPPRPIFHFAMWYSVSLKANQRQKCRSTTTGWPTSIPVFAVRAQHTVRGFYDLTLSSIIHHTAFRRRGLVASTWAVLSSQWRPLLVLTSTFVLEDTIDSRLPKRSCLLDG